MTFPCLIKLAIAAFLGAQSTVNSFSSQPIKAFAPRAPGRGFSPKSPLNDVSTPNFEFIVPSDFEVQDSYEQGAVPLFAVVNATMRNSELIYQFAAVRKDIRENPDKWIDGEDMLTEGDLTEEEIGEFVAKNHDRVAGNELFSAMLAYEQGIKGDNRVRCMDDKYSDEELVYGINVNRYVSCDFSSVMDYVSLSHSLDAQSQ